MYLAPTVKGLGLPQLQSPNWSTELDRVSIAGGLTPPTLTTSSNSAAMGSTIGSPQGCVALVQRYRPSGSNLLIVEKV